MYLSKIKHFRHFVLIIKILVLFYDASPYVNAEICMAYSLRRPIAYCLL